MADSLPFNIDEFTAHARTVAARFEERRAQFLKRLKLRCAIAFLLLASFSWWYPYITQWDDAGSDSLSAVIWFFVQMGAGIVIIVGILVFAVLPLFRYRNYTAQIGNVLPMVSGVIQQAVSLKGEIFSQLFRYFGNFTLYHDRRLALKSFRDAPNMPDFDEYEGEDYIRGVLQGVSVEINEITLKAHDNHKRIPLFNGLMIILDINNSDLVLHGKFTGKTIVIIDRAREDNYVVRKYSGYSPVALSDSGFAEHVEAFTTDPDEAQRLLTSDLLRQILKLSDTVRTAKNQTIPMDDKIAYAISALAIRSAELLANVGKGGIQWLRTGHFSLYATRPELQRAEAALPADAKALSSCVHCAFYGDKVLITIPYEHNLFEPDSIVRPPLHSEDIKLVYNMMSTIGGIANAVLGALPKSAF